MNKRLFSIILAVLLLMALLPAAAFAEGNIVVNLGTVRAGDSLDLQMATTDSGTASLSGGTLPDSCSIVTEDRGGSFAHYLRGTPGVAGSFEFTLVVTDTIEVPAPTPEAPTETEAVGEDTSAPEESGEGEPADKGESAAQPEVTTETVTVATLTCSINVLPAIPSYTVQDVDCFVGEEASIRLQASVADSGTLSYQWYSNSIRDNVDGELLEGKTEAELVLNTEFVGQSYYYCVVTNNNNGLTESVTTPVVTVSVTEPSITSVAIASLPTKLEYTEGDTIDTAGLTLTVHYSNGMVVTDDEGFSVSPTKLTTVGTQTVTVNYQDNTVTFPVIVKEEKETLEGIAVTTLPAKREYRLGEHLDTTGLALEAITNKGNRSQLTSGYSCSPEVLNTAGIQTITVSYEGKTTSFTVTVQGGQKTVQKIAIESLPTKLNYQVGDSFDSSGMVLRVTTDQGDELVRSGFTCSPTRFTRDGVQTVTVSYGSQSCSMELTVAPAAEKPEVTPRPSSDDKPDEPKESERPVSPSHEDSRSDRASSAMLLVIIFTALVALVALLAYLYVTKKDDLLAIWQRLTGRGSRDDEDDEDDEEE